MVCPKCGAQIEKDSNFCRFCGTPAVRPDTAGEACDMASAERDAPEPEISALRPDAAADSTPQAAAPAPEEATQDGSRVAFTYENGYRLDVPETDFPSTATAQAEPWQTAEAPKPHKKKKILLIAVAVVLIMALTAGVTLAVLTFADTGALFGLFSAGEDKLAKELERTWYLSGTGSALVLLEFDNGYGTCAQQYQLFGYQGSEMLAEFTYEITGRDTVRISYGGKVQEFQVDISDDGQQMTLSPHLLTQGTEIWLAYN